MKKIKKIITLLLICLFTLNASVLVNSGVSCRYFNDVYADETTYTEGTLYYTVDNGSITITGCFGRDSEVSIPSQIAGYPVNTIASGAFTGNDSVKKVVLPDTITTIEQGAFASGIEVTQISNKVEEPITDPSSSSSDNENSSSSSTSTTTEVVISGNTSSDGSVSKVTSVSNKESVVSYTSGASKREIVAEDNSVKVVGDSDYIPSGAVFAQELIEKDSEEYQEVLDIIEKDDSYHLDEAYDLFVYTFDLSEENGVAIHELNGYVEVSLPVPSDITIAGGQEIHVYLVNEDGSLTKCQSSVSNGVITFRTNHFSTYIFAVENSDAVAFDEADVDLDEEELVEESSSLPITYILFGVAFVLIVVICIVMIIKNNKKKNHYRY